MFINIPNNYSSMWGELNFEYTNSTATDIVIEISDSDTGEIHGVKKFYSTDSAKINIAPMLFEKLLPEPQRFPQFTATSSDNGFVRITAQVGSETTPVRCFTYAKRAVEAPAVLTSMPSQRLLCAGECEQISVICDAQAELRYCISGASRDENAEPLSIVGTASHVGGAANIYINADDYCEQYASMALSLWADDEPLEQIEYTLEQQEGAGYRMAWVSTYGSVEYYTFPIVEEQVQLSSGAMVKSLRSAYGTAQEVEALSEIIASPKVWRVTPDGFTPIEVLTDEQVIRKAGALMIINLKIKENG